MLPLIVSEVVRSEVVRCGQHLKSDHWANQMVAIRVAYLTINYRCAILFEIRKSSFKWRFFKDSIMMLKRALRFFQHSNFTFTVFLNLKRVRCVRDKRDHTGKMRLKNWKLSAGPSAEKFQWKLFPGKLPKRSKRFNLEICWKCFFLERAWVPSLLYDFTSVCICISSSLYAFISLYLRWQAAYRETTAWSERLDSSLTINCCHHRKALELSTRAL